MPNCPGCEQSIPYDQLDIHERHCEGIWSATEPSSRSIERLELRVVDLEKRINGKFRDLESDMDRRLGRLETNRREPRTTTRE